MGRQSVFSFQLPVDLGFGGGSGEERLRLVTHPHKMGMVRLVELEALDEHAAKKEKAQRRCQSSNSKLWVAALSKPLKSLPIFLDAPCLEHKWLHRRRMWSTRLHGSTRAQGTASRPIFAEGRRRLSFFDSLDGKLMLIEYYRSGLIFML